MPVTVGGGVQTPEDIRRLLLAGADKVSINTAAIHNPDFVEDAAANLVASASLLPSTRKELATILKSSPMADAGRQASTRSVGPVAWKPRRW